MAADTRVGACAPRSRTFRCARSGARTPPSSRPPCRRATFLRDLHGGRYARWRLCSSRPVHLDTGPVDRTGRDHRLVQVPLSGLHTRRTSCRRSRGLGSDHSSFWCGRGRRGPGPRAPGTCDARRESPPARRQCASRRSGFVRNALPYHPGRRGTRRPGQRSKPPGWVTDRETRNWHDSRKRDARGQRRVHLPAEWRVERP